MSMTELERRCLHNPVVVKRVLNDGDAIAIVRAVLAEAGKALLSDDAVDAALDAYAFALIDGTDRDDIRAAMTAALAKIGATQ